MKTHRDLVVWQKSIELVKSIYLSTEPFPASEQFGLTSQMRRSAVSIPSNIAEGCGRKSDKELVQFLYIALGSASELETQLIIAMELGFMNTEAAKNLLNQLTEIIKMASSLIKTIYSKTEKLI